MPLISINIPCYNRKELLRECLESFNCQTFNDYEIIVVDDGSEDDLSFVLNISDKIKLIRQDHLGISKAFNLALDNSSGKYIMPFGSDDISTPFLLEETYSLLKSVENKFDVVYPNFWFEDNNKVVHRKLCNKTLSLEESYKEMLIRQYIPHGGSLWKKEKHPRYDETLESAVDWELFLTALEQGVRFKHLKYKLWIHRSGHDREFGSNRQTECCEKVLNRRGYSFDKKYRKGFKICN